MAIFSPIPTSKMKQNVSTSPKTPLNTAISLVPQPTKPKEPHFAEHRVQSARTASHSASSAVLSPIGAIDGKGLRRASGSAALVRSCFVASGKHRAKNASVFTAVPLKIE